MDEHEKILKAYGRELGTFLSRLLIPEAGLPRPIIGLNNAMPVRLPVDQETVKELLVFARDHRREFHPPTLVLHVQLFNDPYHRKTLSVPHPYAELTTGESITRLDDPWPVPVQPGSGHPEPSRGVKLAQLTVPDVPPEWRSTTPLELILQVTARHVRHGVALGQGPTIPLRVPRQEIPGKATGV